VPKSFQPTDHLFKGVPEFLKLFLVLLQPFPKKFIALGIRLSGSEGGTCRENRRGDHASDPWNTPKRGDHDGLDNPAPRRWRGLLDFCLDRFYDVVGRDNFIFIVSHAT